MHVVSHLQVPGARARYGGGGAVGAVAVVLHGRLRLGALLAVREHHPDRLAAPGAGVAVLVHRLHHDQRGLAAHHHGVHAHVAVRGRHRRRHHLQHPRPPGHRARVHQHLQDVAPRPRRLAHEGHLALRVRLARRVQHHLQGALRDGGDALRVHLLNEVGLLPGGHYARLPHQRRLAPVLRQLARHHVHLHGATCGPRVTARGSGERALEGVCEEGVGVRNRRRGGRKVGGKGGRGLPGVATRGMARGGSVGQV
eukprot:5300229-Pyramimonas_sp.AAC.1